MKTNKFRGKILTVGEVRHGTSNVTGNEWQCLTFDIIGVEDYERQGLQLTTFSKADIDKVLLFGNDEVVDVDFVTELNKWQGRTYLRAKLISINKASSQMYAGVDYPPTPSVTPTTNDNDLPF